MQYGEVLTAKAEELGMDVKAIADKAEMAKNTVAVVLGGGEHVNLGSIKQVAKVLGAKVKNVEIEFPTEG